MNGQVTDLDEGCARGGSFCEELPTYVSRGNEFQYVVIKIVRDPSGGVKLDLWRQDTAREPLWNQKREHEHAF